MKKIKYTYFILLILSCVFASKKYDLSNSQDNGVTGWDFTLGRIGDYGYPDNPQLDRAKGYILKGKVNSAVLNYGNYITWDYHPSGMWNNFGYLPNVSFIAGVPGHVYSSKWSTITYRSWVEEQVIINGETFDLWTSVDAYKEWFEDCNCSDIDFIRYEGNFAGIVYNTIDDRGDLAMQRTMVDSLIYEGGVQWILDKTNEKVILYLDDIDVDPNYAESLIGLAYPWAIRPALIERTDKYDKFDYGEDKEEWSEDDNYVYYGATSPESWFVRDGGIDTDWQATEKSRFNTHNTQQTAGEIFGSTTFTDPDDPDRLLAHSQFSSTWPELPDENGELVNQWPGWWADEYYGDNESAWSQVGITGCDRNRLDEDCWKPLKGRHISDMDIYMEFDDRWAERGNKIVNNEYQQTGYPLGLKVMSMAHSYGISYAEDIMFVTVQVRNESGDWCAFRYDEDGKKINITTDDGNLLCGDGMVMPDGTKLNKHPETGVSQGFDYKDVFLGFYMDADVLSTDFSGNFNVHTNPDDFMVYLDCLNDPTGEYYPDGCPVINGVPLRISMAVIGDWDGVSNSASGYSMQTGETKGPDFGVVAVQLLDSPYATEPVDLTGNGLTDIYPGQKLKMTDWHWFDWYNRPGVVSRESDGNCCAGDKNRPQARNKELIQYKVMSGDINNLSDDEKVWFFHTPNPDTDLDSELNPHFDSLEGLEKTSFFEEGDDGLDCVLEMSSGPFSLEVGETVNFSFAIIFGQNIDDLKQNAKFAQIMYNSHYQGYTAPLTPTILAIPGHNQVELLWDNVSELSTDVITGYTDFEGYKIYKSIDGGVNWGAPEDEIRIENISVGWQPYAQFDLSAVADSAFNVDEKTVRGTGISGPDATAPWFNLGDDTGLKNILLDSDCWDCAGLNEAVFGKNWKNKCNTATHCQVDGDICVDILDIDLSMSICNVDSALVCDEGLNCCGISHKDYTLDEYLYGSLSNEVKINKENTPQCYGCYFNSSLSDLITDEESCLIASGEWKIIFNDSYAGYKYKYVDEDVFDGLQYTYSVTAYDMGVIPEITAQDSGFDSGGNFIGFVPKLVSIPDPGEWGKDNSFQTLESPRGTTQQDKNFVKVIPGHTYASSLDSILVVPNPYTVSNRYNETIYKKKLRFTRLIEKCTITIYTVSGEKVQTLNHNIDPDYDGDISDTGNEWWDLRTYNNQEVAPGLYIYVVEPNDGSATKIGKFAIIR